jgi:hypothetical protein
MQGSLRNDIIFQDVMVLSVQRMSFYSVPVTLDGPTGPLDPYTTIYNDIKRYTTTYIDIQLYDCTS